MKNRVKTKDLHSVKKSPLLRDFSLDFPVIAGQMLSGIKIHAFTLATWKIKSIKFQFPVGLISGTHKPATPHKPSCTSTILIQNNSCCRSLSEALFGYSRWMLFRHIHLNSTGINIWQNFQEGIPFLLEAAAQFSDFGYSINKIKEKIGLNLVTRILQLA